MSSVGSCFMLSSRVLHRKLPLNDMDSTPYDIVFAFGSLQRFFFLRSYFTHFFSWNSNTIDGFMFFNDLYISVISFCRFLRELYSCCYAIEAIGTMNHNHWKVSLMHVYVHDLFSYLHFYCRIAISKGNN